MIQSRYADAVLQYEKAQRVLKELGRPYNPELAEALKAAMDHVNNKLPDPWQ